MSVNTNTDLTEEDAADLQFPKEAFPHRSASTFSTSYETERCANCSLELPSPHILCVVCNVDICSACFAEGVEFGSHYNDHSYRVMTQNFALFKDSDWTAGEELTLLDSLLQDNNWESIEKKLPGRSIAEIKEHYDYFYMQQKGSPLLPKPPQVDGAPYPMPIVPYRIKVTGVEDPPRYTSQSVSYLSVAGYNAARSDFELDYDAGAEELLAGLKSIDVNDPDYKILSELQCAIVSAYNVRLRERRKRKRIIKTHGLILLRKTVAALHRYNVTITRPVYERLMCFMQFFKTGMEFDYLLEGLHHAGELKMQITRLCEFRKKGITTLAGARLYIKLKKDHEEGLRDVKLYQMHPQLCILPKTEKITSLPSAGKKRSIFTPIEIEGMPGYEKLESKEMELCRNVRLVPLTYLELRDTLIAENKKLGCLKLQTARRLLKIDVNKTRKLYDFLVQEGYVVKPK